METLKQKRIYMNKSLCGEQKTMNREPARVNCGMIAGIKKRLVGE